MACDASNSITFNTATVTAGAFVKSGGTSSQYLKADGSVSTLTNPVTGTGTTNYLAKFTSSSAIGNSLIQDDGTYVGINGVPTSNANLAVYNDGTFGMQFSNIGAGGSTWQIGPTNTNYGAGGGKFVFTYAGASLNSILTLVQASGNVGIGTVTPSTKLEVNGFGTANSIMTYPCAKFYGGGTGGINIGTDGTYAMIATDTSGADMQFLTRVAGVFYPRITITSGGNVGIGTVSPNFKTHISTGSDTSITQPTAGTYGLYIQQNTSGNVGGLYIQDGASNSGNSMFVGDNNGAVRFVIDTDGKVGIGVTPSNKLDVIVASSNSGVSSSGIAISDGAANRTLMFLGVNTANYTYIQSNQDNVSSRPLVLQGSGGNVLIGSTNDAGNYKLDVLGDARIQGGATGYAIFNLFDNTASGSNWAIFSGYPALGDFTIRESGIANRLVIKKTTGESIFSGPITLSANLAFSSSGSYGLYSSNEFSPSTGTFNNGGTWAASNNYQQINWSSSSATLNTGAVIAGFNAINRNQFTAASVSISVSQAASGIRAVSAFQILQQTGGSYAGTISHGASMFIQGIYPTNTSTTTFTNYYGLLINALDEWQGSLALYFFNLIDGVFIKQVQAIKTILQAGWYWYSAYNAFTRFGYGCG